MEDFPKVAGEHFSEWATAYAGFQTAAQSANPPDANGLLGFILPPAAWLLLPGNDEAFAPFDNPGDPPAAAAAQLPWNYQHSRWLAQNVRATAFRTAVISKLDPTALAVIKDAQGSLLGTTLTDIFNRLRAAYAVARPADLALNHAVLKRVFALPDTLEEHILRHLAAHAFASGQGVPLSEPDKTATMRESLIPCNRYSATLSLFPVLHTTVATQTFATLATMLRAAEADMAATTTAAAAGYAHATVTTPQQQIASLEATVRQLQMDIAAGRSTGRNPPADRTQYCWSHGRGYHSSADCKHPREGHQTDATRRNPKGGKPA